MTYSMSTAAARKASKKTQHVRLRAARKKEVAFP